jgi:hypothetical protein
VGFQNKWNGTYMIYKIAAKDSKVGLMARHSLASLGINKNCINIDGCAKNIMTKGSADDDGCDQICLHPTNIGYETGKDREKNDPHCTS